MPVNLIKLKKKGWKERDIHKLMQSVFHATEKKSPFIHFLDMAVYWIIFATAVIGNFIISVVLIPILVIFAGVLLLVSVAIVGLLFGILLNLIITEVEHFQHNKVIFLELLIPVTALINLFLMVRFTNLISEIMITPGIQNPYLVGIVYALALSLPRFVVKYKEGFKLKSSLCTEGR